MRLVSLFNDLRKPGARVDTRGGKETIRSRTIQYIYDVTMSIFKRAVEWGVLSKNLLEVIQRPQISKEDKKARKDRKNYFEENEATEDYVDIPQWYMDELAKHIKAMRKAKLEAKALGVWQGGDRNFVFHCR